MCRKRRKNSRRRSKRRNRRGGWWGNIEEAVEEEEDGEEPVVGEEEKATAATASPSGSTNSGGRLLSPLAMGVLGSTLNTIMGAPGRRMSPGQVGFLSFPPAPSSCRPAGFRFLCSFGGEFFFPPSEIRGVFFFSFFIYSRGREFFVIEGDLWSLVLLSLLIVIFWSLMSQFFQEGVSFPSVYFLFAQEFFCVCFLLFLLQTPLFLWHEYK